MESAQVRQPAVDGAFYPADAAELRLMIEGFLEDVSASGKQVPKAIIAPHAGYIYSGPIAAHAYKRIIPAADRIKHVILTGPTHRVPFKGIATTTAEAFATPLGTVSVNHDLQAKAEHFPHVRRFDEAHVLEHSLEVQLPFLQVILPAFDLVPLAVGDASADQVADVLNALRGGDDTLLVISSDLSHYLDYNSALRIDTATTNAIEELDPDAIKSQQACGRIPIQGLLLLAQQLKLKPETVDLRSSGDTAGPRDQVVGYGAYVFTEEH